MKNAYNESNFQKQVITLLVKQGFSYIDSENMKQYRIDNDGFFDVQVFLLKNIISESLIKINKNKSEPSGLRKTTLPFNSLGHRTTWQRFSIKRE